MNLCASGFISNLSCYTILALIFLTNIHANVDENAFSKFPSVDDSDGMFTSSADLEGLLVTQSEVVEHLQAPCPLANLHIYVVSLNT